LLDGCNNHDKWLLQKADDNFTISYLLLPNKFLTVNNNLLSLSSYNNNSLFILSKNKNGSYYIKCANSDKYIKNTNGTLILADLIEDDYNFEFYFENVDGVDFAENNAEYIPSGKFIKKMIDTDLNEVIYDIDEETGLTKAITDSKGNTIYYLYDLTGLLGFKYNNDTYYYIKNIQGDIIGILDQNYNEIVTYEYDSWGKLLSIKDNQGNEITDETNIGIINPFRYREYYYDTETGLYYLNNRYYNPTWGRFVNSDKLLGANANILSYNLYLYVSNNPINNCDPEGLGILKIIKAGVKAVVGVVKSVVNLVQSWNSKTPAEKKAFLTAPIPGIKGYKAAKSATSIGKNIYGNTIVEDDHNTANAYKHTLWNAIMTYEIGREFAKIYADAHEDGQTDMDATNMDLYNNAIGREIGDIYKYNENLAMQKSICPVPSRVHISCTGTQTFIFLGKEYTATAFSREAAYETMSQMVLEAIDQGMLVILIP